jgi:hypothetical protein
MSLVMKKLTESQFKKIKALGIRHFDDLIHEQSKEWLIKNFSHGATTYPVNVTVLIRNIIWQLRERIESEDREPLKELIRTFWYMYIKPTLGRAGALNPKRDQYKDLVKQLVHLVVDKKVMSYADIGFRDDKKFNRQVGINSHVILFSEKLGHQEFLKEIADLHHVSIFALGGQPSALSAEYFVDDLKKHKVDLRRSFYLFSIVDYDPSGWIIRDAFIKDLVAYGIPNISYMDLIHPDMLTPEEIQYARYPIHENKRTAKKNTAWLRELKQMNYQNQIYLVPEMQRSKRILYGLEAESVSAKRLKETIKLNMSPYLGKNETAIRIYQLTNFNKSIQELILYKMMSE